MKETSKETVAGFLMVDEGGWFRMFCVYKVMKGHTSKGTL